MRHLRLLAALGLGLATPFAIAIEPQTVTSPAPVLTPEEQQLAALSPLSDLIAEGESLTVGDYNAANSGRAMDLGKNGIVHLFGRDCSQVTIGDIMDAQYRGTLHAAGRYQIIGRTMSSAVKWTNAVWNSGYTSMRSTTAKACSCMRSMGCSPKMAS